jgi:RimJ/RimL family protein N-acetyltransferase
VQFVEEFQRMHRTWGVWLGDDLVGIVAVELVALTSPPARDAFTHIALARRAWGQKVIHKVGRQVLDEIFREWPALTRVSAWTLASNTPALRVARALGFTREGVMRSAVVHGGRPRDLALYGLLREEFNPCG